MTRGTSTSLASVLASSVFPDPVGPTIMTLVLSRTTGSTSMPLERLSFCWAPFCPPIGGQQKEASGGRGELGRHEGIKGGEKEITRPEKKKANTDLKKKLLVLSGGKDGLEGHEGIRGTRERGQKQGKIWRMISAANR